MTSSADGRSVRVNELRFHVEDHGAGTPVLLLHGWPDSSHLWRHQVPALVEAGYRVVAPDLRGFGGSARPKEPEAYPLPILLSDVIGIMDELRLDRVHVVGHDWGAALTWEMAIHFPERVDRVMVMSVPHPGVPLTLEQRERGWFRLLFLLEDIAEAWLQHDDWALFRELFRGEGDIARYLADLSRPGALTASLNWYRANLAPALPGQPSSSPPLRSPVLAVWPVLDHLLTEERLMSSQQYVAAEWRYERIEGAGHWVPLEAPAVINRLLLEWLAR